MNTHLNTGDTVELQKGMKVFGLIPAKFVYSNRKTSNKSIRSEIEIGKIYENDTDLSDSITHICNCIVECFSSEGIIVNDNEINDFVRSNIKEQQNEQFILRPGLFKVVKTTLDGGGFAHGAGDDYPNKHHVFCEMINNSNIKVDFYQ